MCACGSPAGVVGGTNMNDADWGEDGSSTAGHGVDNCEVWLVPAWIRDGRMCVCPWDAVRAVCATRQPRSAVNLGCT